MLSREERINLMPEGWIYCHENSNYNQGIYRMKSLEKKYFYWYDHPEHSWIMIQQPRGYYCRDCYVKQHQSDYDMCFDDGTPSKFWNQCDHCKLSSARAYAAKKWTKVLRELDESLESIRFATFTMKNPTWKLKDIGFNWKFHDDQLLTEWLKDNCRYTKDKRWKYLGEIPYLIQKTSNAMRDKLKLRIKNMRHKHKNFMSKVEGGIVCYEATINVLPETREIELHPHLHCILHGKYYPQQELQDDWGLGIVDIRKITDKWKVQLEVAKYVGKDGSRRTAWGSIRKMRSKMLEDEREARLNSSDSLAPQDGE
jgi:hypothetical protein